MKKEFFTLTIAIFTLSLLISACTPFYNQSRKAEKRKKQLEITQQEKYKETEKQYLAAVEKHNKNQSKKAREEMKRNYKKAEKFHNNEKIPFYKRWFLKKQKKTTPRPKDRT